MYQSQFQILAEETQKLVAQIQSLAPEINRRLMQTYSHLSHFIVSDEEFGDERAKDLIDRAIMQSNPKRAIELFQRALNFGQKGIQASKAYIGLGMQHEDRGNIDQAIEYYTQAIEAWKPTSLLHFWRGRLYARQKRWDEARHDLESALSFSSEGRLRSPEYEQAKELLDRIVHRNE